MFGRKNYVTKCDLDYTKFKKRNVIEVASEVLMDNNLANPDLFPEMEQIIKIQNSEVYESNEPVFLLSVFPFMDSQHD